MKQATLEKVKSGSTFLHFGEEFAQIIQVKAIRAVKMLFSFISNPKSNEGKKNKKIIDDNEENNQIQNSVDKKENGDNLDKNNIINESIN